MLVNARFPLFSSIVGDFLRWFRGRFTERLCEVRTHRCTSVVKVLLPYEYYVITRLLYWFVSARPFSSYFLLLVNTWAGSDCLVECTVTGEYYTVHEPCCVQLYVDKCVRSNLSLFVCPGVS